MQKRRNISDVVNRIKDVSSQVSKDTEAFDRDFAHEKKRHRNLVEKFDHIFEIVSHPLMLAGCCMLIGLVNIGFRYFDNTVCQRIATDTAKMLSYIFTVFVTTIFNTLFESRKRK
jgi:hypothetical protein